MRRRPKRRWCYYCDRRAAFPALHYVIHFLDILIRQETEAGHITGKGIAETAKQFTGSGDA